MPDDERLGGTRDPHENGRRHRRDEPEPGEEKPRRRRRSMEGSGGVSVADLVQKHSQSRSDLTPVNPDQLRQNALAPGRRARQDRPGAEDPAGRGHPGEGPRRQAPQTPISEALDGGFPQDDAPRHGARRAPEPSFPQDEAPRRPRRAGEASAHHSIPATHPQDDAPRRANRHTDPNGLIRDDSRRAGAQGFPADEPPLNGRRADEPPRNGRRADEAARTGRRRAGEASTRRPIPGEDPTAFPADPAPRRGARRAGEASAHYPVPGDPNAFPADPNAFPADDARNGRPAFPADEGARRPSPGPRRAGEASAHHAFPQDEAPRNGRPGEAHHAFPPDEARNGRPGDAHHSLAPGGPRAGDAHHAFPPDEAPRNGRRPGEASAHHAFPPDEPRGARPGDPFAPDEPSRGPRPGQASAHHAFPPENPRPGDPFADEPSRGPRPGEAAARRALAPDEPSRGPRPGEAAALHSEAPRNGRRPGEASTFHTLPPDIHRVGEASSHHVVPAFPEEPPRPSRRVGEASSHLPIPGYPPEDAQRQPVFPADDARNGRRPADPHQPFPQDEAPRNGRRPGEASAFQAFPPDEPSRGPRVGEASAHHAVPGFPPDEAGPRNVGQASTQIPLPPRPEGAARRRAARASVPPPPEARFPSDAPPQPGQTSGRFPVDDPRRQGPPTPPPANHQGPPTPPPANRPPRSGPVPMEPVSEPRLTPEAIDAPDAPQRPRTSGVPPVPPPLPPRGDDDLVSMTTEMEAIGEEVQKRRTIDHTLARFSAVHDEIKAEEREKKAKRRKLRPWGAPDTEMDHLDDLEEQQSMAMRVPVVEPEDEQDPDAYDDFDEDAGKRKGKRKGKKGLRRWGGRNAGKTFAVIAAGLVFASTATGWGFKSYIEALTPDVDALDPDSSAIQDAAAQQGDENFLLVGSDTRAGATAGDGVGDAEAVQGARSDTVMVAHIPANRARAVVVSFPRDLEVTRPACEGWDATSGEYNGTQHEAKERVKINTAYQVGGPKCVTKMVQELSGLAINHFVGIDFHGFKEMVDAVQGVDVCVERPMMDDVLGTVVPEAGKSVRLSGDQALNFVRARHVEGDITSDYGRITRQQRFLSALLRKAMSTEVLLNPSKLTAFVKAFSTATFGDNIGVDQLFTLGQSMQGMKAGRVTFITVPTVGESNERNNEELRVDDNNALFEAIRQDSPLPGEEPAKPADDASKNQAQQSSLKQDQPPGPVDPATIKIQVLNGGNEEGGIAGDTADALADYGFQVVRVGSTAPVDKTIIKYAKERAAQAQTLQAAVPNATLQEDASMVGAIQLVVGPGFDGNVVSPTGEGPKAEVPDNLSTVNAGDVSCA